ncbi:MAG: L-rhamnose mutarotase, partial [Kiritimatiellae bacterium]|nr:L-rhamnose mutarotase [Kiritimatiellia bacterium]
GVRNYSIFRCGQLLFSHFEMSSDRTLADFERAWAQSEACCRWEERVRQLHERVSETAEPHGWVLMREVFHEEGA